MLDGLNRENEALRREVEELHSEVGRLRALLGLDDPVRSIAVAPAETVLFPGAGDPSHVPARMVDRNSPRVEKIALFRSYFSGRDDVYAKRWESTYSGKSGWSPDVKGGAANARKPDRELLPLTDDVVNSHLAGAFHAGLYPLMRGDGCRLLACDFDGGSWVLDALAYMDAAREFGLPATLERSRSGDGGHVWIFFAGTIPASSARRIGAYLLREAMTVRGEIDLSSYDRLFPTQDVMPKGSFGNLIALPLNGTCRKKSNTVFLDPATMEPFEDQWAHLSSLHRLSPEAVAEIVKSISPIAAGPDDAFYVRPRKETPASPPPEKIAATVSAMVEIDRIGMPPALLSSLKHLASLHNPVFHQKERMRFSTWDTPRFVRSYGETFDTLLVPRGLLEKASAMVADAGSEMIFLTDFAEPSLVGFQFRSKLTPEQDAAVSAVVPHDLGVIVAPPGSGKTVMACAVIAHHDVPTLVIVDRKPLADQWRERIQTHLGLEKKQIGQVGGGRNRAHGVVDIAMAQSLARRDDVAELTRNYGLVVVDECHHVPAVTFERCVKQIPVQRWLGLTATPYRRDELQGLITMYCGPIRYRIAGHRVDHELVSLELAVHLTAFTTSTDEDIAIQEIFRALVNDDIRTKQICDDVYAATQAGRNCLVLTQWTEHIDRIVSALRGIGADPLVLFGGIGKKERMATTALIDAVVPGQGIILVATGGFVGEGFDVPALDTLFIAFPFKFKGRVVQYAGRVMRPCEGKVSIEIHDYADAAVPVLARMQARRVAALEAMGFRKDQPRMLAVDEDAPAP